MSDILENKIIGCLAAGAAGDTLGRPVEGWDCDRIEAEYGVLDDPFAGMEGVPGQPYPDEVGTDDTALAQILCRLYLEKKRRVGPEEYAAAWLEQMKVEYYWYCMTNTYELLLSGHSARAAGAMNIVSGAGIMSVNPVAVFNAGDPEQAFYDALELTSMFQRGLSIYTAGVMAAGMAEAFSPDATADSVIDAAIRLAPSEACNTYNKRSPDNLRDSLARAVETGRRYSDPLELRKEAYEKLLQYQSFDCQETLDLTFAVFAAADGDVRASVVGGANIGRDSDTISSLAGQLAGALKGFDGMPEDWQEKFRRLPGGRNLMGLGKEMAGLVRERARTSISVAEAVIAAGGTKQSSGRAEHELESRVSGAFLGAAAGSMCGRFVEHTAWRKDVFERLESAASFPGPASELEWGEYGIDFNCQIMTLCRAFLEHDGLPGVEEEGAVWLRETDPLAFGDGDIVIQPRANPVRYVLRNTYELLSGGCPPRAAGSFNVPMPVGLYTAVPAAMVHACNPEEAYLAAVSMASLFQRDRGTAVPGLIAAMAAEAMKKDATAQSVLATAGERARSMPVPPNAGAIPAASPLYLINESARAGAYAEGPEDLFRRIGYLIRPYTKRDPYKILVITAAVLAYAEADVEKAVHASVLEEQCPDFAGGSCGFVCGALGGIDAVPQTWINLLGSLKGGEDMRSTAADMCRLALKRARRNRDLADKLDG